MAMQKKKKILEQELVFFLLLVMFQTNLTDDIVNYVTVVGYYYLYQLSHNGVESIVRYGLIKDIRYQKHKPYTWNMKINTSVAIVLGQTGFINSRFSFSCIKCSETQHLSYYLGFWGCFQNSSANFVGTCYPRKWQTLIKTSSCPLPGSGGQKTPKHHHIIIHANCGDSGSHIV